MQRIHDHNLEHMNDTSVFKPNLKGMVVINGVTNWKYDAAEAMHRTACSHFLVDPAVCDRMDQINCTLSMARQEQRTVDGPPSECSLLGM